MNLEKLTDTELLTKTKSLAQNERDTMVDLLIHLVEVDNRSLYLSQGYSSMFDYLIRCLKFSSSAAGVRVKAIRTLALKPEVRDLLRSGDLTLSTLSCASEIIKTEPKALDRFKGVSKKEAKAIASEYKPAPKKKIKDSIKPLGRKKVVEKELPLLSNFVSATPSSGSSGNIGLAPACSQIRFQASSSFTQKLEQVQSLLSRKFPRGVGLEDVFSECMEAYLEKRCPVRREKRRAKRKQKMLSTKKTSKPSPSVLTRHVPDKTRDEIFIRDGHRCTYVSEDGIRCECKHNLHLEHIKPFAVGGGHEPQNLRVLCHAHNQLMAKLAFGETYIQSRIGAA